MTERSLGDAAFADTEQCKALFTSASSWLGAHGEAYELPTTESHNGLPLAFFDDGLPPSHSMLLEGPALLRAVPEAAAHLAIGSHVSFEFNTPYYLLEEKGISYVNSEVEVAFYERFVTYEDTSWPVTLRVDGPDSGLPYYAQWFQPPAHERKVHPLGPPPPYESPLQRLWNAIVLPAQLGTHQLFVGQYKAVQAIVDNFDTLSPNAQ